LRVRMIKGYSSMLSWLTDMLLAVAGAVLAVLAGGQGAIFRCMKPVKVSGCGCGFFHGSGSTDACSFITDRCAFLPKRRRALPGSHIGYISLT
jgi:hypothetical protein